MRLGIDAMGGDYAPEECIKGALLAKEKLSKETTQILFGDKKRIEEIMTREGSGGEQFEIVDCQEVIGMAESPTRALQEKPNSSISVGFQYLKKGKIDSFSSAGSTGAMLVGSVFSVKTVPGVMRPALSTIVPKLTSKFGILLDVGANADCKPEMLQQFGYMGSLYIKHIYDCENPRVGLLNIGEEEGKGNKLAREVFQLLSQNKQIQFVGNMEGRDLFEDKADVYVCDGFTGNIILKFGESFYDLIKRRKVSDPYFDAFNYENYGGTGILGVNAPVVIAHGISNAKAFYNMIMLSRRMVESNIVGIFKNNFHPKK
jgi:phosphate acyltransferase